MVPNSPDRTALLTPQEVAEILRVSPRTVRRLAACGQLDRLRLGYRTTRYAADNVDALIASYNSDEAPAGTDAPSKRERPAPHGEA